MIWYKRQRFIIANSFEVLHSGRYSFTRKSFERSPIAVSPHFHFTALISKYMHIRRIGLEAVIPSSTVDCRLELGSNWTPDTLYLELCAKLWSVIFRTDRFFSLLFNNPWDVLFIECTFRKEIRMFNERFPFHSPWNGLRSNGVFHLSNSIL